MEKFEFNPVRGFQDGSAYTNPSNEAEAREQLMRPSLQLKNFLNNLIELLNSSEGAKEIGTSDGTLEDTIGKLLKGNNIKEIRVNDDGSIEYTRDGSTWQTSSSSGHLIMNEYGDLFQQRSRLQFVDATVEDDGEKTIVRGIKGDKGATGPGVPKGGSIGQKLVKKSDTSYDTEWVDDFDVEDSLESDSTTNAPSVNAVKKAFSNPNLLINGDFQVWQRGTSFTELTGTAKQVFCADRWSVFGGINAEKIEGGIKITGGTDLKVLNQRLEFKLKSNTDYTVSTKINGTVYTKTFKGGNYFNGNLFTYVSWGDEFDAIGINVSSNETVNVEWVKLEQGSIATPFVPRLYAEELALCQRYYQKSVFAHGLGYAYYNKVLLYLNLSHSMRTNPTISFDGGVSMIRDGIGSDTISSMSFTSYNDDSVITIACKSSTSASNGSIWRIEGGSIYLDAEIY